MTDELTERTVLVVEDERELADLYADYLDEYDVRVAYTGDEALDQLEEAVDAMLLDRRMPIVSGNEILADLEDRNFEIRVALVTAVNPDFDIIDLGIEDYLVKPVTRDEVRETVDRLVTIDRYSELVEQLTSKQLKRNVLMAERTQAELSNSEEFQRLTEEIDRLESDVESLAEKLGVDDLEYI